MKNNNIQAAFAIMFSMLITFVSCEREDDSEMPNAKQAECIKYAANDNIPDAQQWNLSVTRKSPSLSKGYYIDLSLLGKGYEFDSCTYRKNRNVHYKVMKIYRRNSNKYFYIMMENLNINLDTGCCAYNRSESNAAKYGRLYSWFAANAAAQDFTMKVPIYKANGDSIPGYTVKGRLPNEEDIYDLLEVESLGMNCYKGFSIDDCYDQGLADDSKHMYYDMFLFGMEDADADDTKAFPRLGGGYSDPHNCSQMFAGLNEWGQYWTSVAHLNCSSGHKPFRIDYKDNSGNTYNFVASAYFSTNVTVYDNERLSVRYVFEPKYLGQ